MSVGRVANGSLLAGGRFKLYPLQNIQACEEAIVQTVANETKSSVQKIPFLLK
ncbi:MAG: hypothetical protein AAB406_01760 [Pseudomonadota bacterium]